MTVRLFRQWIRYRLWCCFVGWWPSIRAQIPLPTTLDEQWERKRRFHEAQRLLPLTEKVQRVRFLQKQLGVTTDH